MIDFKYGKLQVFLRKRLTAKQPLSATLRNEVDRVNERREMLMHNDDEGDELYIPESTMYIGLADHSSTDGVLRNIDMLVGGLLLAKDTLWECKDKRDETVQLGYAIDMLRGSIDLRTLPNRNTFSGMLEYMDKAINALNERLHDSSHKNITDIRTQAISLQAGRIADTISYGGINMARAIAEKPAAMTHDAYVSMLKEALELSKADGRNAFGFIVDKLQAIQIDTHAIESIGRQQRALNDDVQAQIECLEATRECLIEAAKASGYNITRTSAKVR